VEHFRACIDYCLFRGCALVEQRVLGCQTEEEYVICEKEDFEANPDVKATAKYPLLPSRTWPSDHLALLVTVALSKQFN
jgi:hypothetical protein